MYETGFKDSAETACIWATRFLSNKFRAETAHGTTLTLVDNGLHVNSPDGIGMLERVSEKNGIGMSGEVELLKRVYDRFNTRDMETVLAAMHEDVTWANGMDGGYVHGRDGVRSYWTRQWAMIDPRVEPVSFTNSPNGEFVVEVHQTVRDAQGNILADQMVGHIFRLESGLIKHFDIRRP